MKLRFSTPRRSQRRTLRHCLWQALAATLIAGPVWAATPPADMQAQARFDDERAVCLRGESNQAQSVCLKEAGAAFEAARHGQLESNAAANERNRLLRCQPLPQPERDECNKRMQGEGTSQGTAASGGILRELVTPVPAPGKPVK